MQYNARIYISWVCQRIEYQLPDRESHNFTPANQMLRWKRFVIQVVFLTVVLESRSSLSHITDGGYKVHILDMGMRLTLTNWPRITDKI